MFWISPNAADSVKQEFSGVSNLESANILIYRDENINQT